MYNDERRVIRDFEMINAVYGTSNLRRTSLAIVTDHRESIPHRIISWRKCRCRCLMVRLRFRSFRAISISCCEYGSSSYRS